MEVGLTKILLFPQKLAALTQNGAAGRDLSYPISVELSLTNDCNQNCLWCSDRQLRHRSPDRLNLPILKKLFADLAEGGTRGITIEGGGEPTLAHFLSQAVKVALGYGLAVGLITNGLELFNDPKLAELYPQLEWVRVSLDAATKEQYLALKGLAGFDRVMANITELKKIAPHLTLGVGYVLTKHNDAPDDLAKLAGHLRSLGLAYLQIRPVIDHPSLVSSENMNFLNDFSTDSFSVNLAALTDNETGGNHHLPCLAHSLTTVIGADGAVWLCGRLNMEATAEPIGWLTENSFNDIWHGEERAKQISLVAHGNFCSNHCPQCRLSKYNKLLAQLDNIKTRNFI